MSTENETNETTDPILGADNAVLGSDQTVLNGANGNSILPSADVTGGVIPDHKQFPSIATGGNAQIQANNSIAEAQAEENAVAKEQERLKTTGPIGIDYTSPEEREKTMDEHRKENDPSYGTADPLI